MCNTASKLFLVKEEEFFCWRKLEEVVELKITPSWDSYNKNRGLWEEFTIPTTVIQ